MSDLILYTNPRSRGRIVRWVLEELGVEYKVEVLSYGASMKGPEFLAINPMGKVPAVKHGEAIVTETAAICAYLADAFPEKRLAPSLSERADYYRWFFFAAGPLEAAATDKSLAVVIPADKQPMVGYGSLDLVLDTLEKALSKSDYITGSNFTVADAYVGSHLIWGMQFGTIEPRPVFKSYVARLTERSAYVRASKLDDDLMPQTA